MFRDIQGSGSLHWFLCECRRLTQEHLRVLFLLFLYIYLCICTHIGYIYIYISIWISYPVGKTITANPTCEL